MQTITQYTRASVVILTLAVALCIAHSPLAESGTRFNRRHLFVIKDAIIPVFLNEMQEPAAIIRIGIVHHGYQRHGFYRIGMMPALLLEDVFVDIAKGSNIQETLFKARVNLTKLGNGSAVELDRISFQFHSEPETQLRADRLLADSDNIWRLRGHIVLKTPEGSLNAESAALTIQGTDAGQLVLQTARLTNRVVNLFCIKTKTNN